LIYNNDEEIIKILKNKSGKARFIEIKNLCKSVTSCRKADYGCGAPVPKIKIESKNMKTSINIVAETVIGKSADSNENSNDNDNRQKKTKNIITAEMCYNIFKNISDSDCDLMGIDPTMNRPEMMILKYFIVPPVAIRPTGRTDILSTTSFEDDLTMKLADIIKTNNKIFKNKEKEEIKGRNRR